MKLPKPKNWNKVPKDLWEIYPNVFVLDLWAPKDCEAILKRVGPLRMKAPPPNSMNRYGVVLYGSWFRAMGKHLVHRYIEPVAAANYPRINQLKRDPYAFVVDYDMKKQRSLAAHFDSAHVTLNVCLSKECEGGELVFYDEAGRKPVFEMQHVPGRAIIHRASHVHRAKPLRSGRRSNLILWCEQTK